jgi:hypothetical protein
MASKAATKSDFWPLVARLSELYAAHPLIGSFFFFTISYMLWFFSSCPSSFFWRDFFGHTYDSSSSMCSYLQQVDQFSDIVSSSVLLLFFFSFNINDHNSLNIGVQAWRWCYNWSVHVIKQQNMHTEYKDGWKGLLTHTNLLKQDPKRKITIPSNWQPLPRADGARSPLDMRNGALTRLTSQVRKKDVRHPECWT